MPNNFKWKENGGVWVAYSRMYPNFKENYVIYRTWLGFGKRWVARRVTTYNWLKKRPRWVVVDSWLQAAEWCELDEDASKRDYIDYHELDWRY